MGIEGALFDFSGTTFRLEEKESWFTGGGDGWTPDVHEAAEIMRRMTAPVGQSVAFDAEGQRAWDARDLDSALHRHAYLAVLRGSGVPEAAAERLYGRLVDPAEWAPYADTGAVLETLAGRGIRVGIVSNIAFDIRPAFAARGWDRFVDVMALSYEIGAAKPDPAIFRHAIERLGTDPARTLMIGDSDAADGGVRAVGGQFALVDPLPIAERPRALTDALAAHGITVPG
ncbi:HAD family hydrolase [Nocardia thailandica]